MTIAIRNAIKALMLTVPDVGVVHTYERYIKDMVGLKSLYVAPATQQLLGWNIRRVSVKEIGRLHNRSVEYSRWRICGYMALDDSAQSELTMDALIEAIRDAFRVDDTLGGTVAQCSVPGANGNSGECALQVEDFGPVMFASVLCHGVKLGLNTYRYLTSPT